MSVPFFAKALFDYEAVESSELSVTAGDFLTVEEARKGDANGWLPTDYVQKIESDVGVVEPIAVSKPAHTRELVATEAVEAGAAPAASSSSPAASSSSSEHKSAQDAQAAAAISDVTKSLEALAPASEGAPAPTPAAAAPAAAASAPAATAPPPRGPTLGADGQPLNVCHHCNEGIRSAFVMAKQFKFHPHHFQCGVCKCELGGRAYMEKGDVFYCEDDYYTLFNPKCGQCSEVIKGAYISALDQSWHPDHFVCTHCSEPFGGNQFRKHDNKPYCEKHFEELFAPKCAACGLGIAGQVFEALEQKYHLDCFKCAADGAPIGEGVMFHIHEGKIYCPTHFESMFLQRCAGCKEVIKGQYIKVMDKHFHSDCWKCVECSCALNGGNCALDGAEFYCKPCLTKKRANPPQQVKQQMGANPQAVPSAAAAPGAASTQPAAAAAPAAAPAAAASASASAPVSESDANDKAAAALKAIKARQESEAAAATAAASAPAAPLYADPSSTVYPYALLKDKTKRPADVDPAKREAYLSDAEFLDLFKLSKADFGKLPEWRKKALKTPLMLF